MKCPGDTPNVRRNGLDKLNKTKLSLIKRFRYLSKEDWSEIGSEECILYSL